MPGRGSVYRVTPAMQTLMRDIARLWDGAVTGLYGAGDVGPVVAALADDVVWTELPTGAGGSGRDAVVSHLTEVAANLPGGLTRTRLSRTLDVRRVVDEVRFGFVHDRPLPWLLPGTAPTGQRTELLAVQLVRVRQGRIDEVRTLWDVAGARTVPAEPVTGPTARP
ncbi:carboxymethylenebutenolidase [Pseudonocardia ammonioxydans]|uniref:Carboxymethylenebutenolidase n=1 Tax=Pseudonocardia ammonioxydans TaxID=260086 RepID=A0A1I4W421_PSUAM|nr:carboxymethylenebutenolidase [Pseudonocardia ammonioxydans]